MDRNTPLDRGDFRLSRSCFVAIAKLRVNIFSYACSITLFDFVVSLFTSYSLCFQFTSQPCESCSQILNFARALEQWIEAETGLLKFILKLGFVLALLFVELVSCLHSRRQFSLCWFEDWHPRISSIWILFSAPMVQPLQVCLSQLNLHESGHLSSWFRRDLCARIAFEKVSSEIWISYHLPPSRILVLKLWYRFFAEIVSDNTINRSLWSISSTKCEVVSWQLIYFRLDNWYDSSVVYFSESVVCLFEKSI